MAELGYAPVLETGAFGHESSTLSLATIVLKQDHSVIAISGFSRQILSRLSTINVRHFNSLFDIGFINS